LHKIAPKETTSQCKQIRFFTATCVEHEVRDTPVQCVFIFHRKTTAPVTLQ